MMVFTELGLVVHPNGRMAFEPTLPVATPKQLINELGALRLWMVSEYRFENRPFTQAAVANPR
jgi:hypothetical protein